MPEFTHTDVLLTYEKVLELVESTKNDLFPFNPKTIIKILLTYENYIKTVVPRVLQPPDFKNMLYTLIEEQASIGFVISPALREEINDYRKTMDTDPINLKLQRFLIHSARLG